MERWLESVRRDRSQIPSAQDLTVPQLRDHVPSLLDEIINAVVGETPPDVEADGREHGRQRWGTGYDIQEVLRELAILREVLMDRVEERATARWLTREEEREVRRRIQRVIDRSAQVGAAQFHDEAMSVRRQLWAELEAAYVELKVASEQKDRFFATLSHELRNPLSPILTAVQLLEFTEDSDPRLRRAREIIERQVRHQARLIDDLLDVSRIASGKMTVRREPHNLVAAVAFAVEGCLPEFQAKAQELHVEMPDAPLPVDADPVRLEQVVTNLLTNACKFSDRGGNVWLTVTQEGTEAMVRVRDTGMGIGPELLPRVFDLFTQADTAPDRPRGGLGIGLALVRYLVQLHGGWVQAHSEGLGKGAEFVVCLPLATADTTAPVLPRALPDAPAPSRRVVVVEDNADARAILAELLEMMGHEVAAVADGPAALRLAEEAPPEAFVVDIGLPGMDGYRLAQSLRRLPGGQSALLIALSGYGSPEEKERALEAGFDAHLTKPANIDELQRLLTQPQCPPA
jgi:two-component system CheB/CheR fusion protein